jgi:hypothetical protein
MESKFKVGDIIEFNSTDVAACPVFNGKFYLGRVNIFHNNDNAPLLGRVESKLFNGRDIIVEVRNKLYIFDSSSLYKVGSVSSDIDDMQYMLLTS